MNLSNIIKVSIKILNSIGKEILIWLPHYNILVYAYSIMYESIISLIHLK